MGKRGSDKQLTKDDAPSDGESVEPTGKFKKASAQVLGKRRIVRRSWGQQAKAPRSTPGSTSSKAGLFPNGVPPHASSKPTPFAGLKLASDASVDTLTTVGTVGFSFSKSGGAGAKSTSFGFPTSYAAAKQSSAPPTASKLSAADREEEQALLAENRVTFNNATKTGDYHTLMLAAHRIMNKLDRYTSEKKKKKSSSLRVSFGAPTTSKTPPKFAFGSPSTTPAAGLTTRNAGATPAAKKPMENKRSSIPAVAPTKAVPSTESSGTSVPKGSPKGSDKGWNVVHQVKSKYYKVIDDQYKSYSKGLLKLEKFEGGGERPTRPRIIMRDAIGRVMLNLAIAQGVTFETRSNTKKTREFVQFMAQGESDNEPTVYMLEFVHGTMEGTVKFLRDFANQA